jgi:hypothetical protein
MKTKILRNENRPVAGPAATLMRSQAGTGLVGAQGLITELSPAVTSTPISRPGLVSDQSLLSGEVYQ